LYGYAAAKISVEITRFMLVHRVQDEMFAAIFKLAAESITASFANSFARRLRFRYPGTDYGMGFDKFPKTSAKKARISLVK
jgi:hypothetical protein